jgi:hypothetical protein
MLGILRPLLMFKCYNAYGSWKIESFLLDLPRIPDFDMTMMLRDCNELYAQIMPS